MQEDAGSANGRKRKRETNPPSPCRRIRLPSALCLPSSVVCPLSSFVRRLPSVFLLPSSALCLPSSVVCLLSTSSVVCHPSSVICPAEREGFEPSIQVDP